MKAVVRTKEGLFVSCAAVQVFVGA